MVGAIVARNEADRYLVRTILNLKTFCDEVLVVDDHSTDDTVGVAKAAGATVVRSRADSPLWGHESPVRAELWGEAARLAGSGWVYFADADHITEGGATLRELTKSWVVNAWALPLYDIWTEDETQFRADGFWQGFQHPRVWMVAPSRVPEGWQPQWSGRGIHAGHIPGNFPVMAGVAPSPCFIKHLGYATPHDRMARYERYQQVRLQLNDFERAHAETILD
jgi:glycosyltransferase involved in cell wall biosynthesis